MLCCPFSAILYSLPSFQVLIFLSPPTKGLAEPPHVHTLHAPSRSPHLLGGPCPLSSISFRTIFNQSSKKSSQGNPSFGIRAMVLQRRVSLCHFLFEFFLNSCCSSSSILSCCFFKFCFELVCCLEIPIGASCSIVLEQSLCNFWQDSIQFALLFYFRYLSPYCNFIWFILCSFESFNF